MTSIRRPGSPTCSPASRPSRTTASPSCSPGTGEPKWQIAATPPDQPKSVVGNSPPAALAGRLPYAKGVTLDFSRPGKPTDNAFIEAFNGRFRSECLNAHWFLTLADAREKMEDWLTYYNEVRPHGAIATSLRSRCKIRQCTQPAAVKQAGNSSLRRFQQMGPDQVRAGL